MITKNIDLADAIEAAQDGDWVVAAKLYRKAGRTVSAENCERRLALEIEAKEKAVAEAKFQKEAFRLAVGFLMNR